MSNVTNAFGAAVFSRSENKGSAKMYLVFFYIVKKQSVHLTLLYIFLWKMLQMHLVFLVRCKNAFLHQMHFCKKVKKQSKVKCSAQHFGVHFPLENVQQRNHSFFIF